jgi:hypothetical protein
MELPSEILSADFKKLSELSQLAENISNTVKKFEMEQKARFEAAERASIEKIAKIEKESEMRIASAEKLIRIKEVQNELRIKSELEMHREKMKQAENEFQIKSQRFEAMKSEIERCAGSANDKIRLNVGGTLFVAGRDTLLSVDDTLFCHLLGSKEFLPDSDGEYFMDRNSTHFSRILTYLRTHEYDIEGLNIKQLKEFKIEWDYYLLPKQLPQPTTFKYVEDFDGKGIISWMKKENYPFSIIQTGTDYEIQFQTISVSPTYCTMRKSNSRWQLEGSNNERLWVALRSRQNITVNTWKVSSNNEFFRYFRVTSDPRYGISPESLNMSGFEIYGEVRSI